MYIFLKPQKMIRKLLQQHEKPQTAKATFSNNKKLERHNITFQNRMQKSLNQASLLPDQ